MRGRVVGLQAELPISFASSARDRFAIEFVIDTGFSGDLSLSEEAISVLGLRWIGVINARLADDSQIDVDEYAATISWHGEDISVRVLATGDRPLLGTTLLAGSELCAKFVEGGEVRVRNLSP